MVTHPSAFSLNASLPLTRAGGFFFDLVRGRLRGCPAVLLQIDAGFQQRNPLALQELALQGSVRFANQQFAAATHHAVPRYAFSRGRCRHCSARGSRPAAQLQSLGQRPIGNNPSARNLFHHSVHSVPGQLWTSFRQAHYILRGGPLCGKRFFPYSRVLSLVARRTPRKSRGGSGQRSRLSVVLNCLRRKTDAAQQKNEGRKSY
jgi:hypothetical protein